MSAYFLQECWSLPSTSCWNGLGITSSFLWSYIPTRIRGFGTCSSLSWPPWPHLTPQHRCLPPGRECGVWERVWRKSWACPPLTTPPSLLCVPTGGASWSALCLQVSLPGSLPLLWRLRASETDSRLSLAAAYLRHSLQWASSVTELVCLLPFASLSSSQVGRGTQGCDLVAAATSRHPGTCDALL